MTAVDNAASGTFPELVWSRRDQHVQRVERLGRRLFGVASCIVSFHGVRADPTDAGLEAIEAAFCANVSMSEEPVWIPDARQHLSLREHRAVRGAPFIRFYAAYPVRRSDGQLVGSVTLVDYAPRSAFSEGDMNALADLAALVERELQLRELNVAQLELEKKNKSLRRRSLIDPMLGIWNRGAIMRILGIESNRCEKAGKPLSLVVADLDHFKSINDRYGHPTGDEVLVKLAARLKACIRPQEALGRYGGEEFLVVLPGSDHRTAMAVAERMRAAVAAEPECVGELTLPLTISGGVAASDLFPHASSEELISRADVALYAAKNAGRNCVVCARPDLP